MNQEQWSQLRSLLEGAKDLALAAQQDRPDAAYCAGRASERLIEALEIMMSGLV